MKNPFVCGPTKFCNKERLQGPSGLTPPLLTVSAQVGETVEGPVKRPDESRFKGEGTIIARSVKAKSKGTVVAR